MPMSVHSRIKLVRVRSAGGKRLCVDGFGAPKSCETGLSSCGFWRHVSRDMRVEPGRNSPLKDVKA
jgi:hypothetical protein